MGLCRQLRQLAAVGRVIGIVLAALALPGAVAKAADYPIVFSSSDTLRELGIAMSFGSVVPPLANKCYFYGEGGYLVSLSDAFLAGLKERGFTRQSACLGLISESRYDPETGKRLPTYIIADRKQVAEQLRTFGRIEDIGVVTAELPLDVPDCFKNGTPYSDCTFRFGRLTGRPLSAAATANYARLGKELDRAAQAYLAKAEGKEALALLKGTLEETYGNKEDEQYIGGYMRVSGSVFYPEFSDGIGKDLMANSNASILAWSKSFPKGYGYALDADGGAGPSVNAATAKAAIDGLSKQQIDVEELRRRLNRK